MKKIEVAVPTDNQDVVLCEKINKHKNWLVWSWHTDEVSVNDKEWWEFWKLNADEKKSLIVVGRYLLEGLDDFVTIARSENSNDPFSLKKTILLAMDSLYDTVMKDAKTPWWFAPFKGTVKGIIINVIFSLLIDYILNKYKE